MSLGQLPYEQVGFDFQNIKPQCYGMDGGLDKRISCECFNHDVRKFRRQSCRPVMPEQYSNAVPTKNLIRCEIDHRRNSAGFRFHWIQCTTLLRASITLRTARKDCDQKLVVEGKALCLQRKPGLRSLPNERKQREDDGEDSIGNL